MHSVAVYVKECLPFSLDLSLEKLCRFLLMFLTSFLHSVSYFFFLCQSPSFLLSRFLTLLHLTQMKFSQSTLLLMCLSVETLTSVIRTGSPIMVELVDQVNFAIIFLSQMTLLRWLTLLLGFLTVILIFLLFWIYFF